MESLLINQLNKQYLCNIVQIFNKSYESLNKIELPLYYRLSNISLLQLNTLMKNVIKCFTRFTLQERCLIFILLVDAFTIILKHKEFYVPNNGYFYFEIIFNQLKRMVENIVPKYILHYRKIGTEITILKKTTGLTLQYMERISGSEFYMQMTEKIFDFNCLLNINQLLKPSQIISENLNKLSIIQNPITKPGYLYFSKKLINVSPTHKHLDINKSKQVVINPLSIEKKNIQKLTRNISKIKINENRQIEYFDLSHKINIDTDSLQENLIDKRNTESCEHPSNIKKILTEKHKNNKNYSFATMNLDVISTGKHKSSTMEIEEISSEKIIKTSPFKTTDNKLINFTDFSNNNTQNKSNNQMDQKKLSGTNVMGGDFVNLPHYSSMIVKENIKPDEVNIKEQNTFYNNKMEIDITPDIKVCETSPVVIHKTFVSNVTTNVNNDFEFSTSPEKDKIKLKKKRNAFDIMMNSQKKIKH